MVDIPHLKCVAVLQRASSTLAKGTYHKLSFESKPMTDEELLEVFLAFWSESYSRARPIQHAINTHVGFGRYLLNFLESRGKDSDA